MCDQSGTSPKGLKPDVVTGGVAKNPRPLPSRTPAQRREYQRARRAAGRRTCDCGQPATVRRGDGEDICARCALLEERRERAEQRRLRSRSRYGYKFGGMESHGFQIGEQV